MKGAVKKRAGDGRSRRLRAIVAMGAWVAVGAVVSGDETLPVEFQQVVPQGHIVSVDEPRFVPAAEARIPPEAWVFGVLVEGQPRAYSLAILNVHEVVNDVAGGKSFAVVW